MASREPHEEGSIFEHETILAWYRLKNQTKQSKAGVMFLPKAPWLWLLWLLLHLSPGLSGFVSSHLTFHA